MPMWVCPWALGDLPCAQGHAVLLTCVMLLVPTVPYWPMFWPLWDAVNSLGFRGERRGNSKWVRASLPQVERVARSLLSAEW
eukprot:5874642-Amphidinium_carterae.1